MSQNKFSLAVDVFENDTELLVVADVPGVVQGDLDARIQHQRLLLVAKRADGVVFERSFVVPEDVNPEAVSATLKDGVVSVKLPKSKPIVRQIPISVS